MTQDISKKDKKSLAAFDDTHYDAPDSVEVDPNLQIEEEEEVAGDVEYYIRQYDSIIDATDNMTKILDSKSQGYTFTFDPKKNPALASAIRKVFGIDANEITYEMYKEVIDEQTELYERMGDEMFGQ